MSPRITIEAEKDMGGGGSCGAANTSTPVTCHSLSLLCGTSLLTVTSSLFFQTSLSSPGVSQWMAMMMPERFLTQGKILSLGRETWKCSLPEEGEGPSDAPSGEREI